MTQRPRSLFYLSWLLIAIALSLPLQVMLLYNHGWNEVSDALAKLTALNWAVMFGALACAGLIRRASPWSALALILETTLVGANNFFVGFYATDFSPFTAACATLAFGGLNLPLLRAELRGLLRHPERRWWLRAERRRVSVPITLSGHRRTPVRTESYDISESGVFIPVVHPNLRPDDVITVRMTFRTYQQMRLEGRVVRATEARGSYPAGIGIEFKPLSWWQRRQLRRRLHASITGIS